MYGQARGTLRACGAAGEKAIRAKESRGGRVAHVKGAAVLGGGSDVGCKKGGNKDQVHKEVARRGG